MKKIFAAAALISVSMSFVGCVAIHSVGVSGISSNVGQEVTAEVSGMGFLHLTAPATENLEKAAINNLKSQCNGDVKNVSTRLLMRDILGVAQAYKVITTGNCSK